MTKLLVAPKFARETGLPYRLCLQLVRTGDIPGRCRCRIDVRWVEQWLADGGYCPDGERLCATEGGHGVVTAVD